MEIEPAQITGLLGSNGAGKTTCFYSIAGLIKPDQGELVLNGQKITALPVHRRARLGIGYLPQEMSIFRKLNVRQNLDAVLELNRSLTPAQRLERRRQLLKDFQIEHLEETRGIALSGGERRRVEIARALSIDPTYLLLDEPFAGVDPVSIQDIQRMIQRLKDRGIGTLITDHNVRETLKICDRAYILDQGRVLCSGTSEEILNDQRVQAVYLGEGFSI